MTEKDILDLIEKDEWMMSVLRAVRTLNLPDWIIGAGFVRNKVWDYLHGYKEPTPRTDIDVIYFDKKDFSKDEAGSDSTKKEIEYEKRLQELMPGPIWSVTNQARMHVFHGHQPYKSAEGGLAMWIDTATCIGVKLEDNNRLALIAPHGIDDLVDLCVVPTITTPERLKIFNDRIEKKKWLTNWPKLKVVIR